MSKEVHAEPLDTELVPVEDPAMVVGSEPDALHSITEVPTPAIDKDIAVTAQVQEDQLDTAVIPETEPDLPSHGSSSINKGDAVQDSSLSSKSFVDNEVQPEAEVLEESFNTVKSDSGVAAENILPEALPSMVSSSFFDRNIY